MDNYDEFRKYKYIEELDFDHGPELMRREVNPAEVLKPGYSVDHAKEFAIWNDICHDGDYLKEKIWNTAQLWGAYMEEEINNSPDHKLTPRIINGTESLLSEWQSFYDGWGSASISDILATTWKHGEEFAELNKANMDLDKIKFFRVVTGDDAYFINMRFSGEKRKTPEIRAKYLADILKEPENLKYLQKLIKKDELKKTEVFGRPLTEILPVLAFKSSKSSAGLPHILELADKFMTEKMLRSEEKLKQVRDKITKEAERKASEVFFKKEPPESGIKPVKTDKPNQSATDDILYNKAYMKKLKDLKAKGRKN